MGESIRVPDFVELLGNVATFWEESSFAGANSSLVILLMTGMNAKLASVLLLVSYVDVFVLTKIICTGWKMGKFIFAGGFLACNELARTHLDHGHRQEHLCTSGCSAQGICEIETAPQSIEATFTGRHETFQYTKVCGVRPVHI